MMITVYNFFLWSLLIPLLPVIIPLVLLRRKYRGKTRERLGIAGLARCGPAGKEKSIWIHALSVGEVTSALPLVKALRAAHGKRKIILTTATRSGRQLADKLIAPYVDGIGYGPFDLGFVINRFSHALRPELFILVETDFWPNWLHRLSRRNIPSMLVNGRISEKSFRAYRRFSFFFRPMFRSFTRLSMQTAHDAQKMKSLGVDGSRILTLGNLKYDMDRTDPLHSGLSREELGLDSNAQLWVCGSTHPGEEQLIFQAYAQLGRNTPLQLLLAPRDIARAADLTALAREHNLSARLRTRGESGADILILDTLGELAACYGLADLAFVGGSLVDAGGHNPIEPARYGVPVLFGPHMEDFSEIARDLIESGGAKTVTADSLEACVGLLLTDPGLRTAMAGAARDLVKRHQGCVAGHLRAVEQLLTG
jgi:3-deoxy-D-manno-octulosonic-acid transferase